MLLIQNGNISLSSYNVNIVLNERKDKLQVPEGAQNGPTNIQQSRIPTLSETNNPIEEQANPRVLDPPQQEPQEELLPSVPVVPPELPEENKPTTTARSG